MLTGGFNDDLLALANQKATQLKRDKIALYDRIEELRSRSDETDVVVNLAKSWKTADYSRKKEVAMIMIHKIIISEDGSTEIHWNI
jgi:ATP-dependent protease HslVU (ClpYQ) peptidase subunit